MDYDYIVTVDGRRVYETRVMEAANAAAILARDGAPAGADIRVIDVRR